MLMAVGLPHSKNMYDLIIVGGGPAGITAGIYALERILKRSLSLEISRVKQEELE
jgi:thioredoxin reductase